MIPIFVGRDRREPICFHVFASSVARRTDWAVSFTPVAGDRRDGSTDFAYARFLVPYLARFDGWAIFADGDMVCRSDIGELWGMRDDRKAVMVAKHDYRTKAAVKMDGQVNRSYQRKNWSSVMLLNCGHVANRILTPAFVARSSGAELHRFAWLHDELIGEIPLEWNWLVGEYERNDQAKLLHYTLGGPWFASHENCDHSQAWFDELGDVERPFELQRRRIKETA